MFCSVFLWMDKLPEDIILHISGYYGEKIPKELAKEIHDQRVLQSIKETEYYQEKYMSWNIGDVIKKFLNEPFAKEKFKQLYKRSVWKNWDKIVNLIWWSYTSEQRRKLVEKKFLYSKNKESDFITGTAFIASKI